MTLGLSQPKLHFIQCNYNAKSCNHAPRVLVSVGEDTDNRHAIVTTAGTTAVPLTV